MLNTTQNLGINPIVAKLQIRFLPEFEPPMSVTNELYNLLKLYFVNESIVLKSEDFSQNKITNDLSKSHYVTFNFESKDNTFASKLCQLKFPNDFDELSSKIYPSEQEFYKNERVVTSQND